jgi:hypothetical protein
VNVVASVLKQIPTETLVPSLLLDDMQGLTTIASSFGPKETIPTSKEGVSITSSVV